MKVLHQTVIYHMDTECSFNRFANIGCPGRPFATTDPHMDDILPTDDTAWDEGVRNQADTLKIITY